MNRRTNVLDTTMFGLHLFGAMVGLATIFALALGNVKPNDDEMIPLLFMTFVPITIGAIYAMLRGVQLWKETKR